MDDVQLIENSESVPYVWIPGIAERIVSFLPPNTIPCSIRVLDRATRRLFSSRHHTTVRLSQPSPAHAFQQHWGAPAVIQALSQGQRERLVCLTAASGDIPNLEFALAVTECGRPSSALDAAAAAGQLHVCVWLLDNGFTLQTASPLIAAAGAGQAVMCEWLLANGCPWAEAAPCAAARSRHTDLMEWLLQQHPDHLATAGPQGKRMLLAALAEGGDLPTLQRLYREWNWGPAVPGAEQWGPGRDPLVTAAAASPTPDWRAKVEWLEEQGHARSSDAVYAAARRPDAASRLAWLQGRGYALDHLTFQAVVASGNVAAVQLLLSVADPHDHQLHNDSMYGWLAARNGHLEVLQLLHAHDFPIHPWRDLEEALLAGHTRVIVWMVDTVAGCFEQVMEARQEVLIEAARTDNLGLLAALHERGVRWDDGHLERMVEVGGECGGEMMEWLLETGCRE